jgi:hypothetical protein
MVDLTKYIKPLRHLSSDFPINPRKEPLTFSIQEIPLPTFSLGSSNTSGSFNQNAGTYCKPIRSHICETAVPNLGIDFFFLHLSSSLSTAVSTARIFQTVSYMYVFYLYLLVFVHRVLRVSLPNKKHPLQQRIYEKYSTKFQSGELQSKNELRKVFSRNFFAKWAIGDEKPRKPRSTTLSEVTPCNLPKS